MLQLRTSYFVSCADDAELSDNYNQGKIAASPPRPFKSSLELGHGMGEWRDGEDGYIRAAMMTAGVMQVPDGPNFLSP